MSEINLLEIDPDKLFEKYSITKIKDIQKKLQHEIDKKRQELRTMVGERYRDVITASDTIKNMQEISLNLVSNIDKVIDLFNDLKSLELETIEDKISEQIENENDHIVHKSISIQVKVLVYIPEQIWCALDEKDYLKAAQLFLFSQHIYTGLQFDKINKVVETYPIINTQWSKIQHFQNRIIEELIRELQLNDLTAEVASNYLATYVLLENISTTDLLKKFIELRKIALKNVLRTDITTHNTVKMQTCMALKSVVNTIQMLYACFIDSGESDHGLIIEKLNNIISKDSPSTLNLVDLMPDPLLNYLPTLVKHYRPALLISTEPIEHLVLAKEITDWLEWVKESIDLELCKLLNLVTTVKGLDNIREEALKLELPENWELLCEKLSFTPNFNVWFIIFQPLLTIRVKTLIEIKLNDVIKLIENHILLALAKASSGKTAKPELDLRWFVWQEEKNDVPKHISTGHETKFAHKGLLLKSKGFSPNVVELCETFDNLLSTLLKDIYIYMYGVENLKERSDILWNKFKVTSSKLFTEKFVDRCAIQEHLQNVMKENITKLTISIKETTETSDLTVNERLSYYLMTARLFRALTQLSPNLMKCFKRDSKTSTWNELCSYLQTQSISAWEKWMNVMNGRIQTIINDGLTLDLSLKEMLHYLPKWSVVDIEEQSDDTTVTSKIRVPSQPNLHLQNVLFQICIKLNAVIPHTLPSKIHLQLVENTTECILAVYNELSSKENLTQTHALQFLMDVKYIMTMFILRENKKLHLKAQEISDRFRTIIDPFDYDVFYPYLQNNVTISAQRTQTLLGNLIPNPEQLQSILGARQSASGTSVVSSSSDNNASIIPLSDNMNLWFPLLPVTAPTLTRNRPTMTSRNIEKKLVTKVSPKHSKISEQTSNNNSSLTRSGAASFLSDWFG